MQENTVLGVKINTQFTLDTVWKHIEDVVLPKADKLGTQIICTTNPEFVLDCNIDPEFKKIVNESALSLPDGTGTLLAIEYYKRMEPIRRKFKGSILILVGLLVGLKLGFETLLGIYKLKNKIPGVDLVNKICEMSAKNGYTIFLLGGWPKDFWGKNKKSVDDLATVATEKIKSIYPNVHIVGSTSKFNRTIQDDESTIKFIKDCMQKQNLSHIDFIFVAYNHRWQEKWIVRNSNKIPARIGIGVGGTFDYIAGIKKYSPEIIRKSNLEWLYRLLSQPWRLKRIFKAFPIFPLKVYIDTISH